MRRKGRRFDQAGKEAREQFLELEQEENLIFFLEGVELKEAAQMLNVLVCQRFALVLEVVD